MSGVTDFPDEEARVPARKPARASESAGEDEGGGGIAIRLPRVPLGPRITKFYHDVILEMKKVAWPARTQVWSTTVVVVIAVVFFGFYLFGCDYVFNQLFKLLEKTINKR
jgi:preprotein translocase subunit SecE